MRVRWLVGCLALAVSVVVPGTAGASAVPVLAGVTHVSGAIPARVLVRLPRPAGVLVNGGFTSPDVLIRGGGRVVGIVLHRQGEAGQPLLSATVMRGCFRRGCNDPLVAPMVTVDSTTPATSAEGGSVYEIPAGTYQLDLLTDGAPVEVDLRLRGLAGAVRLHPSGRAPYVVDDVPATLSGKGPSPALSLAADHHIAAGGVLMLVVGRVDWRVSAGGVMGACYYGADIALLPPGCAGGSASLFTGGAITPQPGRELFYASLAASAARGPQTGGLSVTDAQLVDHIGATVAWLDS